MRRAAAWLATTSLGLLVACPGGGTEGERGADAGSVVCAVGFDPPSGFVLRDTIRRRAGDHVGTRRTFVGPTGQVLHVFAGIEGEFGEGLPASGSVALASGTRARLLGAGRDWVLVWDGSGPCATRAIVGNGFDRSEFIGLLEASFDSR